MTLEHTLTRSHKLAEGSVQIGEVAQAVNRRISTVRSWERLGMLPKGLLPKRDHRGWRTWTPEQVEGIKKWMVDEDIRPGKALKWYNPSPEQLEKHLEGQRLPRKDRETV